jgi:hypothetical protein
VTVLKSESVMSKWHRPAQKWDGVDSAVEGQLGPVCDIRAPSRALIFVFIRSGANQESGALKRRVCATVYSSVTVLVVCTFDLCEQRRHPQSPSG